VAAVTLPREGAWAGGLTSDGFAVQCRADQACDFTLEVFDDPEYKRVTQGFIATVIAVAALHHYRDTSYVTGLKSGRKFYWRTKHDNGVDAPTYGTESTFTAGSIKTLSNEVSNWKAAVIGCAPWHPLKTNDGAAQYSAVFSRLLNHNLDFAIHNDDIYYSDIQSNFPAVPTAYAAGEFFNPPAHVDATADKYRTNFINTYSGLNNLGYLASTGGGSRTYAQGNTMAEFKVGVPSYYMWGDHGRAFNDCSGRAIAVGDEATRWVTGRDTGQELYMSLNKALVEQDTPWTPYVSDHHYYYVDVPPCRVIVKDTTTDGDYRFNADSPSKSKLGAAQKAWLKATVDSNTQKYLVVISGNMLDGNHGWDQDTANWYGWKGYTYERDEIFDYIRSNGNPYRTIFVMGDTHGGGVFVDTGKNKNSAPIYCVLSGNVGWNPGLHGQINGLQQGATGRGLEYKCVVGEGAFACLIESKRGGLQVSLDCLHAATSSNGGEVPGIKWSKLFK